MVFFHQRAALLGHAHTVGAKAELDDPVLAGGLQQLDNAHAADAQAVGDGLLGHVFEIVEPGGLDHQRFFIIQSKPPEAQRGEAKQ